MLLELVHVLRRYVIYATVTVRLGYVLRNWPKNFLFFINNS